MTRTLGASSHPEADNRFVLLVHARSEPEQPDPHRLLGLPLGALVLSQELIEEGFEPRILDQNVHEDLPVRVRAMPKPLMVGISCDGGEQIIAGREAAELVRRVWPDVPIVWGGWGPTLIPSIYEHPTSARWVDALVRGRGNVAIRELARALVERRGFDGIAGLTWRDSFRVVHRNEDSPAKISCTRAPLPYDLVDWDAYMTRLGVLNYISASGCPHRCSFCSIPTGLPTFDPTDNETVLEHLRIAHERGVRSVVFFDDNFFTSKKRVLDLARRLIDSGLGLQWHSNARLDHLSHVTLDELRLLRESGCTYFNIGLETGDQSIADSVHKGIVVEDMFAVARRCEEAGIGLTVNFIIGLPGETPESQVRSFALLERLYRIQPKMFVYWHLYLPSPGTPMWDRHVRDGTLVEPRTLDEMLDFGRYVSEEAGYYARASPRWFKLDQDRNQAVAWYFTMGYVAGARPGPLAPLRRALRRWCRWRYDRRLFRVHWDWSAFYWPRRGLRRLLWIRRDLARCWPTLRPLLHRPREGHRCHFSLLFEPGWMPGSAAPLGGSGRAAALPSVATARSD